jgi:hypothetical protein
MAFSAFCSLPCSIWLQADQENLDGKGQEPEEDKRLEEPPLTSTHGVSHHGLSREQASHSSL